MRLYWPWEYKNLLRLSKKIKYIRTHKTELPEITSGDNFFFPTPDSLDDFIADLNYGYEIID